MALSLTTAVKDKVARRLGSVTYANATPNLAALIDGEGPDALLSMEMESQWMNYLSASGNAPDAWMPYFVSEIAYRCSANQREGGEKVAFGKMRDEDRARAWEWFARQSVTYSPGTTTDAFVYTVQTVRNYCLGHTLRLKPRLLPAMESIDSALHEVLTEVWNKGSWPFRRRQVTFRVVRHAFSAATWTESTKTITTTGVGTSLAAGTRFYVTAGSGTTGTAVQDEYTIASTTSTTIVLNNSLSDDNTDLTTVDGFYYTVEFLGLEASETFDCFATNYLYLQEDNGNGPVELRWASGEQFAEVRSSGTITAGPPRMFRAVQVAPTTTALLLWPPPDDNYYLRGEVLVRQPSIPTSASTTFTQWASEFLPTIRRMTLDRLLTNSGRHDESLHRQVVDEMEAKFPAYTGIGPPDGRVGVQDVYGDWEAQNNAGFGGRL